MTTNILSSSSILLVFLMVLSCKPEKVKPTEPTKEVSKYDLIPGNYKMYDTLGNFLYEMNIKYIREVTTNKVPRDTLVFTNFDGKYTFRALQSSGTSANMPKYSFGLGVHDSVRDSAGKRVFIFGHSAEYRNDSIFLQFERDNIRYYIPDMVPYDRCECKQIGVKQH